MHRISAEYAAGDPGAAITAARMIPPASLPTTERRARYWTDTARAHGMAGHRGDCLHALLAAEREAPEEIHARPAIRDLISGLLISGPDQPRTTRIRPPVRHHLTPVACGLWTGSRMPTVNVFQSNPPWD